MRPNRPTYVIRVTGRPPGERTLRKALDVAFRRQLLVTGAGTRVLDVGAGCGKLCLVGALTTGASFAGLEQSRWLVNVATEAARSLGAARASFVHSGLADVRWEAFDACYFYI